ncbi:MAG: response regulator transcription factor, partial [Bacteroidetes bacterium]|nr:response regulator transcription factor [Bacteroidota bacterium]
MDQIRIILADDHPAYIAGIRAAIEKEDDMVVLGEVNNGRDAPSLTRDLEPDILLLDMQLPIISGLKVAQQLLAESSPVLVIPLSGFSNPEYVFGALENGASGYMTKDESLAD